MSVQIEEIHIPGARGNVSSPLTWAQRAMWDTLQSLRNDQARLNTLLTIPVPPEVGVPAGVRALIQLIEDCETLRTTYCDTGDQPTQTVISDYSAHIAIHDMPPGDGVHEVTEEMLSKRMDYSSAPPVQVAFFARNGALHSVHIVASPLVADAAGGAVLRARYLHNLSQRPSTPAVAQPLERVVYESSQAGRDANSNGIAHWKNRLSSLSSPLIPSASKGGSKDSLPHFTLRSQAVLSSVDRFAMQTRSLRSAIYYGVLAQRLCSRFDVPQCILPVMSSNRNNNSTGGYAGILAQRSIALFDSTSEDGIMGSRSANREILRSLQNGAYDPVERNSVEQSIGSLRGHDADDFLYHANFLSEPRELDAMSRPPVNGRCHGSAELEEDPPVSRSNLHFWIQFLETQSDVQISMFANPSCFTSTETQAFLMLLERDLTTLTCGS
ncbi:hypothetical protein [Streptomyces sp. NPDC001966]